MAVFKGSWEEAKKWIIGRITSEKDPDILNAVENALDNSFQEGKLTDYTKSILKSVAPSSSTKEGFRQLEEDIGRVLEVDPSKTNNPQAFLQSRLGKVDESGLTDEELQDRLGLYKKLGGLTNKIPNFSVGQQISQIPDLTAPGGYSRKGEFQKDIFNKLFPKFSYKEFSEFQKDPDKFIGANVNLLPSNLVTETPISDTSGDLKRIQDILSARGKSSETNKQIEQFISGLPEEQRVAREQFLGGESERAQRTLEEQLLPEILASQSERGLLDLSGTRSGDLEAQISSAYGDVFSQLQQEALTQEQQDNQFFQDAGYQHALRKSLQSSENLGASMKQERQSALNKQQQGFTSKQSELNRNMQQKLFQRQQERLLTSQMEQDRRQRDRDREEQQARLIGGIGSAVANVGGTILGSRLGSGGTTNRTTKT